MQRKSKMRPGFVRAMVVDIPGAKDSFGQSLKPKPGKTVQIREIKSRDANWMRKHGLVLMPEPQMPTAIPQPVAPPPPAAEKIEPMKPTKVNHSKSA